MTKKHYTRRHLLLAALAGFFAAVTLLMALLWALVGTSGLALLGGWGMARVLFVGDYQPDAVADAALTGLVDGLGDRWSYYVDAEGYQTLTESRNNAYVGIGVTVSYADDRGLRVEAVQEGGPAAQAGIRAGEIITAVDSFDVSGENRKGAVDYILGEVGTEVTLTLMNEDGLSRQVTLKRDVVHLKSVTWEMLEGKVGYVALSNFHSGAAEEVNAAVDELVSQGAESLIFDVRNNGGGYVSELTAILDHLLPEGPIFRSQGKWGRERVVESDAACVDLPMAVLVNGDSYSAAEFLAAQLQESAGAILVGEPTCGKGFAQQTFRLPNGGALNISVDKYYTGAGVSLIGTGVTLDAQVSLEEEAEIALWANTLKHEEDAQLQKALELLRLV